MNLLTILIVLMLVLGGGGFYLAACRSEKTDRLLAVSAVVLALLTLGQPQARAVITVSADYPMEGVRAGTGQASTKAQLSQLIALYDNDVALLVNPEKMYSKTIKEASADPTIEKELRQRALANYDSLTLQSLAVGVNDMVKATPQNAHLIMASAIAMLSDLPGGDSPTNRITLAETALLAIPLTQKNRPQYVAFVIGVAAKGQKAKETAWTVIALRNFATSHRPLD